MRRIVLGTVLATASLASLARAHDGLDAQAPFPVPSVSQNGGGLAGFTFDGISLLSWIPVTDFDPTHTSGNDCWGYVSGSGREYAIIGTSDATAFVEVTDPGKPSIVAVHAGPNSLWRDIKVYQSYAYAVSEGGGGIQVFDMTSIDSGTVTLSGSVTGTGCSDDTHNVFVDEVSGFLYRCGGTCSPCPGSTPQGLVIYDLAVPTSPAYVTTWSTKYVHDVQVVTWDLAGPWLGREIAFCAADDNCGGGNASLYILDVTNKAAIATLGTVSYTSPAFSHQCWLSSDKQYLYLNDELDEASFGGNTNTRVIDVADLTAPFEVATFSSGQPSIDHNLYVVGNLIYEANYRSGLRVFDATTPTAPVQTAWFDTYPDDDQAQFNSLWSVYPYLPSGTIVGSDLEKGLFVWRLGDRQLDFSYPNGLPGRIDPGGGSKLRFGVIEASPGTLAPGSVAFFADSGAGFQSLTVSALGGNLYEVSLPSASCGDTVSFYASAASTDGVTWTDPPAGGAQVHLADATLWEDVGYTDDLEVDLGWSVGDVGDTATTGIWARVDPVGTAAQPEDDHTPDPASMCFVTGQGSVGGSVGDNDVDGGDTTLFSPTMDASAMDDPYLRYWRWFSNNQGGSTPDDVLTVDISNDNGSNWVNVETLGPAGPGTTGGWIRHTVRIGDYVLPTSQMKLRIRTGDNGGGSIVEAAIDDLCLLEYVCDVDVANFFPKHGRLNGGNKVTIVGEGFVPGVTTVDFGPQASPSVTVLSDTKLVAVAPPAPRTDKVVQLRVPVQIRVHTGPGTATGGSAYVYEQQLIGGGGR